jgi:hypothetical protein
MTHFSREPNDVPGIESSDGPAAVRDHHVRLAREFAQIAALRAERDAARSLREFAELTFLLDEAYARFGTISARGVCTEPRP